MGFCKFKHASSESFVFNGANNSIIARAYEVNPKASSSNEKPKLEFIEYEFDAKTPAVTTLADRNAVLSAGRAAELCDMLGSVLHDLEDCLPVDVCAELFVADDEGTLHKIAAVMGIVA